MATSSAGWRERVLDWGRGEHRPSRVSSLAALIDAPVAACPDTVALLAPEPGTGTVHRLSYAQLDETVERRTSALRAAGLGPGDRVGIVAARRPDLIPSLLAILRTGAAYVPLDPRAPADRWTTVGRTAGLAAILGPGDELARRGELPVPTLTWGEPEHAPSVDGPPEIDPLSEAYVLFTSGSTGAPKGVCVSHASAVARLESFRDGHNRPHTALLHTSLCFDAALVTLLPVLATGGTLVVGPDESAEDPAVAADLIDRHAVTFVAAVPSWYSALLEMAPTGSLRSLERVVSGGEVMPPQLVARHRAVLPHAQLVNEYGPTEATVAATAFDVPVEWAGATVAIGRPHPNTRIYLVDGDGTLVEPGATGEIWIGGEGVASGYVGCPDDDAFGDDPFVPGRVYRTGDVAHWSSDGMLELHGRADRQVKIQGQRVEPDETEAVLLGLEGVALAAVEVDRSGNRARLVAFVSPHAGVELDADDLRARLADVLPPAQRPSSITVLDRVPTTLGGKVDRQALPIGRPTAGVDPPTSRDEEVVCRAFAEVLEIDQPGRTTDFYIAGGDSLAAARVASRLRRHFGIELAPGDLREHPTPAALAVLAAERPRVDQAAEIPRVERNVDGSWRGPASDSATSFWYLEQEEGRAGGSNLVEILHLGDVDEAAVATALDLVTRRHTALRSSFVLGATALDRVVHPPGSVTVPITSLDTGDDVESQARQLGRLPFDLAQAPLARVGLVRDAGGTDLVVVVHHAIADGWALDTLIGELVTVIADPAAPLRPIELDAVDVDAWVRERIRTEAASALRTFAERLADAATISRRVLPYDRPPRGEVRHSAAVHRLHLDAATTQAIGGMAHATGASLFSALVASLGLLLRKYGAPPDLLIGAATANRPLLELEPVVACLTNFVPLRVDMDGDPSAAMLVRRVDDDSEASAPWAWLPVETALQERSSGQELALPDVMVSMLNYRPDGGDGVDRKGIALPHALTDLDVVFIRRDGGLDVELHHDPQAFEPSTIDALATSWVDLLGAMAAQPHTPLSQLLAPSTPERELAASLGGEAGAAPSGSILDLIGPHLDSAADSPALIEEHRAITWAMLAERCRRLTASLAASDIGPGTRVVVTADGAAGIEAVLACWCAGATPVPVGGRRPAAAVASIIERCGASVALDAAEVERRISITSDADAPTRPDLRGDELAYILFTSGSTGVPKGVMVSHRALLASTLARRALYPDAPPVALLAHDMAFDVAVGIMAWYLGLGATLVTAPHDVRLDPTALAELIRRHDVGQMDLVPSLHRLLLETAPEGSLASVRLVTVGAEVCPPSLVALHRSRLPWARLVNEYGPTECTVGTVAHECTDDDARLLSVPIGRPMRSTVAMLARSDGGPVPPGGIGELLLGGHLLAEGYVGDPEQTAARFVELEGRRWYRTGDRARWNVAGELEFLGRLDDQLKVRGYRIEPGEVEGVLQQHPDVIRVAVWTRDLAGGAPVLVAWVVAREGGSVDAAALTAHCRAQLPEWMVPAVVVEVDTMPLTVTGKVDRSRLPDPDGGGDERERVGPQTPIEQVVIGVWERLLGCSVGMTDNFFELGGHSLLAARLVADLGDQLGVTLFLPDLLEDATPLHLAILAEERMSSGWAGSTEVASITTIRDGSRAPLVIIARDGETSLYLRHVLRALDDARPLWLALRPMPPITARRVDISEHGRQVAAALAATGVESFHLLGHSASGLVAMETARHLGRRVASLTLLDTLRARSTLELLKHPLHRLRRWLQGPGTEWAELAEVRRALAETRAGGADPEALRIVRDLQDERGFLRLRGRPYDRPVIVLGAEDTRAAVGPDLGWARWCTDLELHELPSDHFGVLLPPHVDATVETLDSILSDRP